MKKREYPNREIKMYCKVGGNYSVPSRMGLKIPVVPAGTEVIRHWRTTDNGKGLLMLVPKIPDLMAVVQKKK